MPSSTSDSPHHNCITKRNAVTKVQLSNAILICAKPSPVVCPLTSWRAIVNLLKKAKNTHRSWEVEATRTFSTGRMGKQDVVYTYREILFSVTKEDHLLTCYYGTLGQEK